MTFEQAKKIPLVELFGRLGMEPVKTWKGGAEVSFRSPFRAEKTASLFVNTRKNVWNDFGDSGGNVLDFAMKLAKTDERGALAWLESLFKDADSGFILPKTEISNEGGATESSLVIRQIKPFGTEPLIREYIQEQRGIYRYVAERHLRDVHFHPAGKPEKKWFAAGFINRTAGFEVRNSFFKGCIGAKDWSFLPGENGSVVTIYEGFTDFLSHLCLTRNAEPQTDVIVLNSVALLGRAAEFIARKKYLFVFSWLHDDAAGRGALHDLIELVECEVLPQNHLFEGCKDLNEWFLNFKKVPKRF